MLSMLAGLDYVKLLQGTAALSTIGVNSSKLFSMMFGSPDHTEVDLLKSIDNELKEIAAQIESLKFYDSWNAAYGTVKESARFVDKDILQTLSTLSDNGDPEALLHDLDAARDPDLWRVQIMSDNTTASVLDWIEGKAGDDVPILRRIYKQLEGSDDGSGPSITMLRDALMISDGLEVDSIFALYLKMIRSLRATGSTAALCSRTDYDLVFKFAIMVRDIVVKLAAGHARLLGIYRFLDEKAAAEHNDLSAVLRDYGPDGQVWSKCDAVLDSLSNGFNDGVNVWSGSRLGWAEQGRKTSDDLIFYYATVAAPEDSFLSAIQLQLQSPGHAVSEYVDSNISGIGSDREYTQYADYVTLNANAAALGENFTLIPHMDAGNTPVVLSTPTDGKQFTKHWVNVAPVNAPTPPDANHVPVAVAIRFVEMSNRVGLQVQYRMLKLEQNGTGTLVGDPQWCGQGANADNTLRLNSGDCGSVSTTFIGAETGLFDAPGGLLANIMPHRHTPGGSTSSGPLVLFAQTTPTMHKMEYFIPENAAATQIGLLALRWADIDLLDTLSNLLVAAKAISAADAKTLSPEDAKAKAVDYLKGAMRMTVVMPKVIGGIRPGDGYDFSDAGKPVFDGMSEAELADALRRYITVRDVAGFSEESLKALDYNAVTQTFDLKFHQAIDISGQIGGGSEPFPADALKTVEDKARFILSIHA